MNIFNSILEKIGLKKPEAAAPTQAVAAAPAKPASSTGGAPSDVATAARYTAAAKAAAAAKPAAVVAVDVMSKLEGMAANNKEKLDWKVSIVDLLKLLSIDSSLDARKELAKELSCPADLMNDSAKMNVWLHKTVLQKIAENGGNVPSSLLN